MKPENECQCNICKDMCKTPCLGTPNDIEKLMDAGYGKDRLAVTSWGVGMLVGTHDNYVTMIQARIVDEYCTFYKNGNCELHDKGLKPTEGALASCKDKPVITIEQAQNTTIYKVVKEWEEIQDKLEETLKSI